MNLATNKLTTNAGMSFGFLRFFDRQVLITILLALVVLMSAFSVVYVRDLNRRLFIELESNQVSQNRLQTEWGKLLLEQSTWSTQARVQQIAQEKFAMIMPEPKRVMMVRQ